MKAMTERFHKQIVRNYKQNYFATQRKQLLNQQQFLLFYSKLLESNSQLISLIQQFDYPLFFKHIDKILDQKLYQKLYHQDQHYFLLNLKFIHCLLQVQLLPLQHIDILISAIAEVLKNHQEILSKHITEIFTTLQLIITSPKYSFTSYHSISNYQLIPKLYDVTVLKQENQHFFKFIQFHKIIKHEQIIKLSDQNLLHCLNIHILTSQIIEELSISYSILGQIFSRHHTSDQQLYQYGSILDKIKKDIVVDRLIDPISFFLVKALKNKSLKKLSIQMGYIEVIFEVIVDTILVNNNISLHGNHSIWLIFGMLIDFLSENKATKKLERLEWRKFKERLNYYERAKYPYVRDEMNQTMQKLLNTNEKNVQLNLLPMFEENIAHQFQEVEI